MVDCFMITLNCFMIFSYQIWFGNFQCTQCFCCCCLVLLEGVLWMCSLGCSPRFETWFCNSEILAAAWKTTLERLTKALRCCCDCCLPMNKIQSGKRQNSFSSAPFLIRNFLRFGSNVTNPHTSPDVLQRFHPVKFT